MNQILIQNRILSDFGFFSVFIPDILIVILIFWYGNPDSHLDSNSDYVIPIKFIILN